ncbi:homocysteine S-methyltransferase [Streptomyces sp. NPDC056716]|uniref:homocysteine S-methyltransferase n=1 Tax=unclassified Streptomyces TaxID=2593676 RepID=UPI00368B0122
MSSAQPSSFAAALAAGTLVLDGGMSNQLEAAGYDLGDALWSARLLAEAPEAIVAAHLAYFAAGADVAITASYQATFEGFARRGVGRERAAELIGRSVELAREAARRAGVARRLWVAGSVGPYGAMLADGSEYRGRYGVGVAELERFHRARVEVLVGAGVDVLALETVPDTDEAVALLRAVRGVGVPVWLSYTVEGLRTRAGQRLEEAFGLVAGVDEVVAVGVNCCAPREVGPAVGLAARVTGKPVVVYPNSGETWGGGGWVGRSAFSGFSGCSGFPSGMVRGWREGGARLVGGCCRVGPDVIASVAGVLREG